MLGYQHPNNGWIEEEKKKQSSDDILHIVKHLVEEEAVITEQIHEYLTTALKYYRHTQCGTGAPQQSSAVSKYCEA